MAKPKPAIDIAALDQANKAVIDHLIPYYASVFRVFCAEEGVTREEAMQLTIAHMHMPRPCGES